MLNSSAAPMRCTGSLSPWGERQIGGLQNERTFPDVCSTSVLMPAWIKDKETDPLYGPRCAPPPGRSPPPVYRARLDDLDGCWFEIECACGNRANNPVSASMRHHGGQFQTLGGLLCRLKCSRCNAAPVSVLLNECWLKHFAHGPTRGWSVRVWPLVS